MKGLPAISSADLMRIEIGNGPAPERAGSAEVNVAAGALGVDLRHKDILCHVGTNITPTPLRLFEHLSLKLILNIISTGTMVRMGRVSGNWMTWLDVSNKKLIDRGIRIIANQCDIGYKEACYQLFKAIEELEEHPAGGERPSPVRRSIEKLRGRTRPANK